jgi:hypothetical protein
MTTFRRKKKTVDRKSNDKIKIDYRQSFIRFWIQFENLIEINAMHQKYHQIRYLNGFTELN